MKNKILQKNYLLFIFIISIIVCISFIFINKYEYNCYRKEENNKIDSIVSKVHEKYPDITKEEIIEIINSDDSNNSFLNEYGIYIDKDTVLKNNKKNFDKFMVVNISFIVLSISSIIIILLLYERKKDKELNKIIECIEKINRKNYDLNINDNSEDELSILKTEIYKTTIMLKESAENSLKDKLELKSSLEDISHQLKTPLTSMLIMVDNLIEEPDMDINLRQDFIKDIKRNLININFLVQSLLKLSKFDSNTIIFSNNKYLVSDIVNECIKNVEPLLDLKNVRIELDCCNDIELYCDYKWQIEAISNIIKNCIEYSYENSHIDIKVNQNNVYTSIVIIDYGDKISSKDLKHIFERFYKGANSKGDSIGIGLSLSKKIIEHNNGTISVESESDTRFIIKYYK